MQRTIFGLLLLLSASPAAAQTLADYDYENLTFRGVGAAVGWLWSDRVENTETYTLRLDLGYLGPGIRIMPSLTYWQSQLAGGELARLAQQMTRYSQQHGTGITVLPEDLGAVKWSDLSLSIDGQFVWNTPLDVLTFVGAGFGLHALNGQGAAIDGTFVEDLLDDITAGLVGIAGFEFEPVPRVRFFGEGRYTVMNSIDYPSLRAGVQFMFSQGSDVAVSALAPPAAPRGTI